MKMTLRGAGGGVCDAPRSGADSAARSAVSARNTRFRNLNPVAQPDLKPAAWIDQAARPAEVRVGGRQRRDVPLVAAEVVEAEHVEALEDHRDGAASAEPQRLLDLQVDAAIRPGVRDDEVELIGTARVPLDVAQVRGRPAREVGNRVGRPGSEGDEHAADEIEREPEDAAGHDAMALVAAGRVDRIVSRGRIVEAELIAAGLFGLSQRVGEAEAPAPAARAERPLGLEVEGIEPGLPPLEIRDDDAGVAGH